MSAEKERRPATRWAMLRHVAGISPVLGIGVVLFTAVILAVATLAAYWSLQEFAPMGVRNQEATKKLHCPASPVMLTTEVKLLPDSHQRVLYVQVESSWYSTDGRVEPAANVTLEGEELRSLYGDWHATTSPVVRTAPVSSGEWGLDTKYTVHGYTGPLPAPDQVLLTKTPPELIRVKLDPECPLVAGPDNSGGDAD